MILNALNEIIKAVNNGVLDKTFIIAWENYKNAATPSRGRGASAGPINVNNTYWKKRIPIKTSKWSTGYIVNGKLSKMKVNNQVASNVLGYYEGTPFMNLPPRMTNYTRTKFDKFQKGLPFIQEMSNKYKNLVFSKKSKFLFVISNQSPSPLGPFLGSLGPQGP